MNIGQWYEYIGTPASTTSTHRAGIDVMVVSQDEISNTSLVRIRPWIMKRSGSGFWNYNSQSMTIKADDQSKTTKTSYDFREATTNDKEFLTSDYPFKRVSGSGSLVSGTYVYDFTINHEDDGSKTIPIYALIPLSSSYGTNWTVDENIDLPTIPRQSQFDISNWSTNATPVEQSKSLKIIEGNPNYYTQLVVRLMQEPDSYLVKRKGIQGGTYNFQFTQEELNNIVYPKIISNSRVIGFSLETYSDSNYTQLVGTSNASPWYTATIENANPNFTDFEYEDSNSTTIALTNNSNMIVQGYSTLKVTIPVENKATGQKGATISGYNIGNYSVPYSSNADVVKEIPNYPNENIIVSAVDSRGNSKSITKLFTDNFINYTDLVILNCEVSREDEIGEKVKIKFDGTWWQANFGGANGGGVLNELTAVYQYQTGNGEFINGTTPLTLNVSEFGKFSCEQYIVGDTGNGFNISNSYKIKVIVSDKLSSKPNTKELIAGEPAIAIFGNNIALHNKYDENKTDIPVQIYGKTTVDDQLLNKQIGDIVITSTNTNPSSRLGGTWEFVNKEFSSKMMNNSGENVFFKASSDITLESAYLIREGHSIKVRVGFDNNIELNDSEITLGTFDFNKMGCSNLYYTYYYVLGTTDGGNGAFMTALYFDTGILKSVDVIPKGSSTTIKSNSACYILIDLLISDENILDEACDKFYWKKVS